MKRAVLIRHRTEDRVRAHVLLCALAAYLVWHLSKAWAPLTYTGEHQPPHDNPVAPAKRSPTAERKASRRKDDHDRPLHDYRGLLDHLATLTRNTVTIAGADLDLLAEPIPATLR